MGERSNLSKRMNNQFFCSSMMLPEHREELETMKGNMKKKPPLPEWDEQALELWERLFQESFQHGRKIKITILSRDRYIESEGVVRSLDANRGRVGIETVAGFSFLELKAVCAVEASS